MFFGALTDWNLRHRKAAVLLLMLFVGALSAGIVYLEGDFSLTAFFGRNDPETTYLEGYLERWNEDDMLVVLADGGENGLLNRASLEAIDALAERLDGVEGVGSVLAPTRIPRASPGFAGTFIPVPLLATTPRADADPERIAKWRAQLLSDTSLVPNFLSADGRYAALLVELSVDTTDLTEVRPAVVRVQEEVDRVPIEGMTFHLAGVPAIRANILNVIVRDQIILVPVAGVLMGLLLLLLFRSRHGVIIPTVAAAIPVLMLLGAMGWTGEPFGLLNQVLVALVPALAMADSVHIVSRYHEEADRLGGSGGKMSIEVRNRAIIDAMKFMGAACFLTASTTVIGFLSLEAMEMPVLRSFGRYAGLGVTLAYITMLFIVPLCLLGTRSGAHHLAHGDEGWVGAFLRVCWKLATRHAVACIAASLLIAGVAIYGATKVSSDWRITHTFNYDHPVSVADRLLDEDLGGILAIELDLKGPDGVFKRLDVLHDLWDVEAEFRKNPEVRTTTSLASVLAAASHLVGGPTAVPSDEGTVARLDQLLGKTGALERFVKPNYDRARIVVRTSDIGAIRFLEMSDTVEARVREVLAPYKIDVHLTGSSVVAARGISRISVNLRDGLLGDCAFICLIIAFIFRSVRFGLLTLVPNALPLLAALGAMGFIGWNLEPGAAVVFTIAIGIAVDSAIHVLSRFREDRSAGLGVDEALQGSIYHSGRAIFISTFILIVGFAVNTSSSSPQNAIFGALGTVIMATSMLTNLIVLPAMLKLGFGGKDDIVPMP